MVTTPDLRYRFPKHCTDTVPSFLKVDFSLSSYIYIPWRRAWQSTPVFLPEEPQGQAGYSPQGCKESDTTEETKYAYTHTHTHTHISFSLSLSSFLSVLTVFSSRKSPTSMNPYTRVLSSGFQLR